MRHEASKQNRLVSAQLAAAYNGHFKVVEFLLLRIGLDSGNETNGGGDSPYDQAKAPRGHEDVASLPRDDNN